MATNNLGAHAHFISPAEAELISAIDTIISNLTPEDVERLSIDFPFLRDYTVVQLQTRLLQLGSRNYTAQACACVGLSRKHYANRQLINLKWKK